jgi:hypothetical protein
MGSLSAWPRAQHETNLRSILCLRLAPDNRALVPESRPFGVVVAGRRCTLLRA